MTDRELAAQITDLCLQEPMERSIIEGAIAHLLTTHRSSREKELVGLLKEVQDMMDYEEKALVGYGHLLIRIDKALQPEQKEK